MENERGKDSMSLISMTQVTKTYRLGETTVEALRGVDLRIDEGEFVAIWGPSGSGKTSLLNLIGMIDVPSSGDLSVSGHRIDGLSDDALAELRNRTVGFVFQNFNLVQVLGALENVMLPLQIRGVTDSVARAAGMARLEEVGLAELADARPDKMSGGQRQRVAIARALVTEPAIVIADEPTANLDSENSQRIISLMRELNRKDGVTFIFSTHDQRLLERVDRHIRLKDGRIEVPEVEYELAEHRLA
jgi:putative ABC transport system ATP-binding protein